MYTLTFSRLSFFFYWGGIFSLCATSKRIPISKRELIIIRYSPNVCMNSFQISCCELDWCTCKYKIYGKFCIYINPANIQCNTKKQGHIYKHLHFQLSVRKLQFTFVMYRPIHFINDFLVLKRALTENYISISNKKSFFEYCMYEMIKYGRGWSNLS